MLYMRGKLHAKHRREEMKMTKLKFAVLAPLLTEQPRRIVISRHHTAAAAEAAARRHAGAEAVCLDDEGDVTASVQECREAGTL